MKRLLFLACVVPLNSYGQTYNVYSQGPNYVGGSYVSPVTVKTYNFSSGSSGSSPTYHYNSGSSYSSSSYSSSSYSGARSSSSWNRLMRLERNLEKWQAESKVEALQAENYNSAIAAALVTFNSGDYQKADSMLSKIDVNYPIGGSIDFNNWRRANYVRVIVNLYKGDFAKTKTSYEINFAGFSNDGSGEWALFCNNPSDSRMIYNRGGLSLFEQFELEAAYTVALCHVGSKAAAFDYWNKAFSYFYPRMMSSAAADEKTKCFEMLASVFLECGKPEKTLEFYIRIINSATDKTPIRQTLCDNMVTRECLTYHPDKLVRQFLVAQLDTLETSYVAANDQDRLQQVYFMKAQLSLLQNDFERTIAYAQKLNLNRAYQVYGCYFKSKALLGMGKYSECISVFVGPTLSDTVNNQYRDWVQEGCTIGDAEIAMKNYNDAKRTFDQAALSAQIFNASPIDRVYISVKQALIEAGLGNEKQAISSLESLTEAHPDNPLPAVTLGNIYLQKNKTKQAGKYFAIAQQLDYDLNNEQLATIK